jgi:hypothetical protein
MRAIPGALFGVLAFMGLVTGVEWLVNQVEVSRCPVGTFLTGSLHGRLPELAADIGLIALIISLALLRPPPKTQAANNEPSRYPAQLIIASLGFVFAGMFLFIATSTTLQQYCLSDAGIDSQSSAAAEMKLHPWSNVVSITSSCETGSRYGKFPTYRLILSDGEQIVLRPQQIEFERVYKRLSGSLSDVSFEFDASAVDPRCGYRPRDLLTTRP